MAPHAFPSEFYTENPVLGSELAQPTLYIHDLQALERHRSKVNEPYAKFLEHADERLTGLSKTSRNAEFAAWSESLRASPLLLGVHDISYFGTGHQVIRDHYLLFPGTSDYQACAAQNKTTSHGEQITRSCIFS